MLLVLSYMIIYNITSFMLFSTILNSSSNQLQTLYSFSSIGAATINSKLLSLSILSLAGVPPLLGFFSKIFVFVLISGSTLFILFFPFFILLFISLYFYIQNMRFLNSTSPADTTLKSELQVRVHGVYYLFNFTIAFFTVFGFCYVDDLFLITAWLLC